MTSSAAAFCGLAGGYQGSVEVEAVAGLKLLLLEPLEGFGLPF